MPSFVKYYIIIMLLLVIAFAVFFFFIVTTDDRDNSRIALRDSELEIVYASDPVYIAHNKNDCSHIIDQFYSEPLFEIYDYSKNTKEHFVITSEDQNARIAYAGGFHNNNYAVIGLRYMSAIPTCYDTVMSGSIVVRDDGSIIAIYIPEMTINGYAKLTNAQKGIDIPLYSDISSSTSDWNNDGKSEYFVYRAAQHSVNSYKVVMYDAETGEILSWFNNGKSLTTTEDIEKIADDWHKQRDFIRRNSTEHIPTAEELDEMIRATSDE